LQLEIYKLSEEVLSNERYSISHTGHGFKRRL
jgi:hypothetical protein